jgi:serine/threonine protein kinase/Tol biopolymer transport system component
MNLERFKQVDRLLHSVLERPRDQREAFLKERCAGDKTLEREVRSLLLLEQEAENFLEVPVMDADAPDLARHRRQESSETSMTLAGKNISHYRVIEKLGDGGMGAVWKARDTRLDRYVALKVLHAAKMSDPERKRRFVQEARSASALNHPNIITIHDIDQDDGADFIAMEFVPGKALNRLIPVKGLPLDKSIDYAIQVADALAAAHAAGIVHRDLKPGNIMVSETGGVKVVDFGLAKLMEPRRVADAGSVTSEAAGTDEGMILGTVAYMSPEQAEGKKVDARSDIFSFGAVLYEMITGRRAFPGDSMVSILSAVLRDDPQPASEIVKALPRDLGKIVTRCLRKDPNQRYQHAGDLKIDLQQIDPQQPTEPESPSARAKPDSRRLWWFAAAAVCIAASFSLGRWFRGAESPPAPEWLVAQLTRDAGLSCYPALSRDGKLLAYSSDAGQDGGMNLYIRQVAGGQPIRLTSDGAGNTWPDFSPDGSKIVFRSNRASGGIFEIPAFGGQIRQLAPNGLRPRFSPDGSKVAYWDGSEQMYDTVPGTSSVWVVSAAGGRPHRVGPSLTAARAPIWSPDGKRLLLVGYTSAKLHDTSSLDWWLTADDGSTFLKTGLHDALTRAGLTNWSLLPWPYCWSAETNRVVFSIGSGDAKNIWEIGISPQTGKVTGSPRRLSAGSGTQEDVFCASGTLAFTDWERRSQIWSLPFDLNRGVPAGAPERITQGSGQRSYPSLSSDLRQLAFSSNQSGHTNLWKRDLATGEESIVARSSLLQRFPVMSPSGARIAFAVNEEDGARTVYVAAPGGEPEKVCEGCVRATDWSSDEKSLLTFDGTPYQVNLLDAAAHRQTLVLKHPTNDVLYGHFSPDNRWISFTVRTSPTRAFLAIAPIDGPRPIPEGAWITIADAWTEDWAHWSPDGRTLYFPSERDGHRCLWGQRIDPVSHRPIGEPFAAWHFHGRASYSHGGQGGWSVAAGRIVIALSEDTGNIWLMSPSKTR